jgi:hypothetical protein
MISDGCLTQPVPGTGNAVQGGYLNIVCTWTGTRQDPPDVLRAGEVGTTSQDLHISEGICLS